jgi:uncharacterized protein (DUF1330 family)
MKTQYVAALAVAVGFGLGAAMVQGLHAQAKLPAFTIAEIDVSDMDGFQKEFAPKAQKAIADNGGKALARGGKIVALYGAPPKNRVAINRFDGLDQALAAYNSAAYKEAKAIGDKYATIRVIAVEGLAQ